MLFVILFHVIINAKLFLPLRAPSPKDGLFFFTLFFKEGRAGHQGDPMSQACEDAWDAWEAWKGGLGDVH